MWNAQCNKINLVKHRSILTRNRIKVFFSIIIKHTDGSWIKFDSVWKSLSTIACFRCMIDCIWCSIWFYPCCFQPRIRWKAFCDQWFWVSHPCWFITINTVSRSHIHDGSSIIWEIAKLTLHLIWIFVTSAMACDWAKKKLDDPTKILCKCCITSFT